MIIRYLNIAPGVHVIQANSPNSAYKLSKNPILLYELKENYRDENPDYQDRLPWTNSHGQRDRERSWIKPNGVRRIIVLGDSVTIGDGIRDLKNTIPGQLEQMLQGTNSEVLNLGVAGYCTLPEVELLKVKGLKYQPDLVLVIFVENDYNYLEVAVIADDVDSDAKPKRQWSPKRPVAIEKLFVNSDMFRYVCMMTNLYGFRDQFQPPPFHKLRGFEGFGNNVREGLVILRNLSIEHDFKTMIAVWPTFTETAIVDEPVCPDDPEKLVIERIAEGYGIPVFRLSSYFQEHYRTLKSELKGDCPTARSFYTNDGMHPNEMTAKIAAKALKSVLISRPDLLDLSVERSPVK